MTVPVHSTVPDSTLSPFQVRQKFAPQSLRGLGEDFCIDYADDGSCNYSVPIDNSTTTINTSGGYYGAPFDPSLFAGAGTPSPTSNDGLVTVVGTTTDGAGNVIAILSNGTSYVVSPSGSVSKTNSSIPMGSNSATVTRAQSNAWASVVTQLINAGVKLGTVANLPPGTSLLPNGTILGSGQSLVRPGVITSNSLTSGINAVLQNPLFLVGTFGVVMLAIFAGGRR